jgi:hypothetical protein
MAKSEEEKEKIGLIELESLKDLVHIIARTPFQTLNYIKLGDNHYYFVITGGFPGISHQIYFIRKEKKIEENFVIYNNLEDSIEFSNKLETRGGISFIPIIHIKRQNLIKLEDFEF